MIGDDLPVDILGAKQVGMSQIYFNPNKKNENMIITQLDFCNNEIFNGSLFEGELIKSEDRKWYAEFLR